jgi:hypothetical protein
LFNTDGPAGVLLGGSVAFSQYASSNANSIAAQLSQLGAIKFSNLNAPSWNSHQELIALAKTQLAYTISISFSTTNDMRMECGANGEIPGDAPENYEKLAELVNDIRGERQTPSMISRVKASLANYFLDTSIFYTNIKNSFRRPTAQDIAASEEEPNISDSCALQVTGLILSNQRTMRQLSEARGARHLLVIQPHYSLHRTAKPEFSDRSVQGLRFRRTIVAALMNSDFCTRDCLDLSASFDAIPGGVTHWKELVGDRYLSKHFVDEVHMTDEGNRIVAGLIAAYLASGNAPSTAKR